MTTQATAEKDKTNTVKTQCRLIDELTAFNEEEKADTSASTMNPSWYPVKLAEHISSCCTPCCPNYEKRESGDDERLSLCERRKYALKNAGEIKLQLNPVGFETYVIDKIKKVEI